jgi:hypothetical protein
MSLTGTVSNRPIFRSLASSRLINDLAIVVEYVALESCNRISFLLGLCFKSDLPMKATVRDRETLVADI